MTYPKKKKPRVPGHAVDCVCMHCFAVIMDVAWPIIRAVKSGQYGERIVDE